MLNIFALQIGAQFCISNLELNAPVHFQRAPVVYTLHNSNVRQQEKWTEN